MAGEVLHALLHIFSNIVSLRLCECLDLVEYAHLDVAIIIFNSFQ